jgi:CHAT domain-containing protein
MQASLFEGSRATVDALREASSGARIIHLATHGFFLENTCRANPALVENPLVRSGIALAGANHRTRQSKSEDGLLTAEEAASLDLDGTRLVVLSGCDTGRGQIENGEGVLGLRRAFRIAGAATLVTSLWPAADDDTRRWMSVFYVNYLTRKLSAAEAVRAADLSALRVRRAAGSSTHPFYWAGFVASGAPK